MSCPMPKPLAVTMDKIMDNVSANAKVRLNIVALGFIAISFLQFSVM